MDKRDLYKQVAELHAACIGQGFLATLGVPFLSLMYQAIDESSAAVLLTEQRDDRVIGFVSGSSGMRQIYLRMLRSPVRLAGALFPSLISPGRLLRMLEILRYGGTGSSLAQSVKAELLSIAVAPQARASGVAEALYRNLANYFSIAGEPAFRIVVGDSLEVAHKFYRRMGALPVGPVEVHHGEGSLLYIQQL